MRQSTQWRIAPAAWVGIALAFLAEATANALRAYGLGAHESQFMLRVEGLDVSVAGAVMVLAAVALSLSQSRAAWVALKPGAPQRRIIAGFTACVLIFVSACAMSSNMLAVMRATGDDATHSRDTYKTAKAAYDAAKADFDKIRDAETVDAVEARIAAAGIDANVWRTNGCTDVTRKSSQDECAPFFKLQKPLADAKAKAELQAKLPNLQAAVDHIVRPTEQSDAEAFVNTAWSWAAALAIILVATVGPVLFVSEIEVPDLKPDSLPEPEKPEAKRPTTPKGGRRRKRKSDGVVSFADAFKARHGRTPSGSEIQAEFPDLPKSTAYDYAARTRRPS